MILLCFHFWGLENDSLFLKWSSLRNEYISADVIIVPGYDWIIIYVQSSAAVENHKIAFGSTKLKTDVWEERRVYLKNRAQPLQAIAWGYVMVHEGSPTEVSSA